MRPDEKKLCIAKRIVPIIGKIDNERFTNVGELIEGLLMIGAPDIMAIISSGGGTVAVGLDIFDLLKTYPGKITGVVYRQADSMAAVILQACEERCCAKHAKILIHHVFRDNVSLDTFESPQKLKRVVAKLRNDQMSIYNILISRTNKTIRELKAVCRKEEPMAADQVIEFGLADRILTRDDMTKWFRPAPSQN